jgi:hypothetical protein
MNLNYEISNDSFTVDEQSFELTIQGLMEFAAQFNESRFSTWKARHEFIRDVLGNKPPVQFQDSHDSIIVTQPLQASYTKNLQGLLQFKNDFKQLSSTYDTFVVRRSFVGEKMFSDVNCDVYISTTEAFTINPIIRIKPGATLDWSNLMKSGTDWDALNIEESWIEEVQMINKVIMDMQMAKCLILAEHLPEVPQFKDYRRLPDAIRRFALAVIIMRGNCCVGKTSFLLNGALPIHAQGDTDFRSYLDGVIASDNFKVSLKDWYFDELDHKGVKFEGLVHLQSMAITDLMLVKCSTAGMPVILDGRYLCEEEVSRVFRLWGPQFNHVLFDIDAELETLLERSKFRKCPRIQESVIVSGQSDARNNRAPLLNTDYSYYLYFSEGTGKCITHTLVAECHGGYYYPHDRDLAEKCNPGQPVAQNNKIAVEKSTFDLG